MPIKRAVRPSGYKPPRSRETASRSTFMRGVGSVPTQRVDQTTRGLLETIRQAVREELQRAGSAPLPTVLTYKMAARELSCSVSKVKLMVRKGQLLRCHVGDGMGIPREEILRIAGAREPGTKPGAVTRRSRPTPKQHLDAELAKLDAVQKKRRKSRS